ncbi:putative LuxR family transcriptional regulator, partial [Mycolicibacterium novocastrense]
RRDSATATGSGCAVLSVERVQPANTIPAAAVAPRNRRLLKPPPDATRSLITRCIPGDRAQTHLAPTASPLVPHHVGSGLLPVFTVRSGTHRIDEEDVKIR